MSDPALTAALDMLRHCLKFEVDYSRGAAYRQEEYEASLALVEQALADAAAPSFQITEHDGMFLITGTGGLRALVPPPAPKENPL